MDLAKLPGLFEKDFVIGFVLPTVLLSVEFYVIYNQLFFLPSSIADLGINEIAALFVVVLGVWVVALVLLLLNRAILRLMSGYTLDGLLETFAVKQWQIDAFNRDAATVLAQQKAVDDARRGGDKPAVIEGHAARLKDAVDFFPDQERFVLGTSFGNMYRAMEVYPRVVYGIDVPATWSRMQAVIPSEYGKLISASQAELNFAVNIYAFNICLLIAYIGLCIATQTTPSILIVAGLVGLIVVGWRSCRAGIRKFGSYMCGAYDLYRDKLAEALGFSIPRNADQEREMWTEVTRAFAFRSAAAHERLTRFRKH